MRCFVRFLLISFVALVGCNRPTSFNNANVNEHNFVKVVQNGTAFAAQEVLGVPDRSGDGEIVRYQNPGEPSPSFFISEQSQRTSPDHFLFFGGAKESILLLFSAATQKLLAAEYLLDGVPIYYIGSKDPACRSVETLTGISSPDGEPDADFPSRRKALTAFFQEARDRSRTTLASNEQPQSQPQGQPEPTPPQAGSAETAGAGPRQPQAEVRTEDLIAAPAEQHVAPHAAATVEAQPQVQVVDEDLRVWTDSSGKHTVTAKIGSINGNALELLKTDGSPVQLALDKLSRQDQQWVSKFRDRELAQKRMEHNLWTIKVMKTEVRMQPHSRMIGNLNGTGPINQNYQVPYYYTHPVYQKVCAELRTYEGSDVTLTEVYIPPTVPGQTPARQYGMSKTFRYGGLGDDDKKFLDDYRRMQKEFQWSREAAVKAAPKPARAALEKAMQEAKAAGGTGRLPAEPEKPQSLPGAVGNTAAQPVEPIKTAPQAPAEKTTAAASVPAAPETPAAEGVASLKTTAPPAPPVAPEKPPAENGSDTKKSPRGDSMPAELGLDLGHGLMLDFALVRAGEFMMGSPDADAGAPAIEKPRHRVRISRPFYLGKYPVTQEQWTAVMGTDPSHFKGAKNPVENVSWEDCQQFVGKLNAKAVGLGGRFQLPTEAQWEYACRAGNRTRYCFGDEESELGDYAWYETNSDGKTHPVGGKQPNAWGLYDMHGNVWQWCQDWFEAGTYADSAAEDPTGATMGTYRVIRGGSWRYLAADCRSASRDRCAPGNRNSGLGFRISMVPGQ